MGKIILFDDEIETLDSFQLLFSEFKIRCELVKCNKVEEFRKSIENTTDLRGIIVDLAKDDTENGKEKYQISADIQRNYDLYRVPIFIHSGNLINYNAYNDCGTVFKVQKGS